MAAEDYMDSAVEYDEWDRGEWGEPGFYPKRRPRVLPRCRYCGDTEVHWVHLERGWRLYSRATSQPHVCTSHPSTPSTPKHTPNLAAIMAGNTQESLTMDHNAVAFIRSDVGCISVAYLPEASGEHSSTPLLSRTDLLALARSHKTYTFLCTFPVEPGDWVVVPSGGKLKTVVVTAVRPLDITPSDQRKYAYAAARIDLAPYLTLLDENQRAEEVLRSAHRASARETFRNALLAQLPDDARASISFLSKE